MSHTATAGIILDHNTFDEYCVRHCVKPETAIAELVNMALGLPADILDYLRELREQQPDTAPGCRGDASPLPSPLPWRSPGRR